MAGYIPLELRRRIEEDAGRRCGYCRSSAQIMGVPLEVEHIVPVSLGGNTERENLWLACHRCNKFKSNRTTYPDPETGEPVQIFDPRRQTWHDHFRWSRDGTQILGLTGTGRATVYALQMNNIYIVESRRFWVVAGWHPPLE
jgi:hypothetical protein